MASLPPSPAAPSEVHNSIPAQESLTTAQPETAPRHILDAMQGPEPSSRAEKDVASEYWTTYERIANKHDDEFIDRHNRDLDALLIFAGLFSSVSSAFIVNMQSSLSPQPSDTTNALLKLLINKVDNGTFSEQEASLPIWTGASSKIILIQSLAYTSLSTSLLAASGGVLAKQWLGHFKTSRFGHGALRERCMRRQRKVDGLKTWHFNAIIAALPNLLQLSLYLFGVVLVANLSTVQHTVASIVAGATLVGVFFYSLTAIASLISPDFPFVSTSFLNHLLGFPRGVLKFGKDMVCRSISCFRIYLLPLWSALWLRTLSMTHDLESTGSLDESVSFEVIDLEDPETPADASGARSIQWIIETYTDNDIIATAVQMVPDVDWPDGHDVTFILDQLTSQLYACVYSPWWDTPHMRTRVRTCLKAIFHLYIAGGMQGPLNIRNNNIFVNDRHLASMPNEQDFEFISSVMDRPYVLDITSLPLSDRMWMAHILTYCLHNGDRHSSTLTFVHGFINKCLHDPRSPPRLVADCLLLADLVIGLQPHRRYLAKIDKSAAIGDLQRLVIDRILKFLLGASPDSQRGYALEARELLRTLGFSKHCQFYYDYRRSVQCLKLCFQLLEDQGDSTDVAAALRLSLLYSLMLNEKKVWTHLYRRGSDESRIYWGGRPRWHTQAQFDLLVDYLLKVGQSTDHTTIGDAFAVLAGLRGSPSTIERKCLYIQMIIQFMGSEVPLCTRHAALSAAYALRTEVASMDRDNEPFRYLFSRALMSMMLAQDPSMQQQASTSTDNVTFNELSTAYWRRNLCYLGLLCALSKEETWHGHLDCHGHFNSCLAIADTVSSRLQRSDFGKYLLLHLTHIFAIVDDVGQDHEFLRTIRTYRIWPLIMDAWLNMFTEPFFHDTTVENWKDLLSLGIVEGLPSVAAYAKKYWEQWDNRAETRQLIQLVEQVYVKLEEQQGRGQSVPPGELGQEGDSCGHRAILNLSEEIRELLDVLQRDVPL